jgi:hypothetical protein
MVDQINVTPLMESWVQRGQHNLDRKYAMSDEQPAVQVGSE